MALHIASHAGATTQPGGTLVPRGATAFGLSAWLTLAGAVAAGGSLFFPVLLGGEPVTDGNLRGTALVVLVLALPLLWLGMWRTVHGSARGLVVWLGAV